MTVQQISLKISAMGGSMAQFAASRQPDGIYDKDNPHAIDKDGLMAIYQLATEVRDRTAVAKHQYAEEAAADRVAFTQ